MFNNLAPWGENKFVSEQERTYKFKRGVNRHTEDNSPQYRMVDKMISTLRFFACAQDDSIVVGKEEPSPAFVTFAPAHEQLLPQHKADRVTRIAQLCGSICLTKREGNSFSDKVFSRFTSHFSLKLPAFTLAEVLITLGIIGVVAAMTMPSLIQNYQRHVWLTQLKKSYSVLTNGFKAMLAEDNVDFLYDTSLFNSIKPVNENGAYCSLNNNDTLTRSDCKDFFEKFKQYFPNSVYVEIVNTYKNKNKKEEISFHYYNMDGGSYRANHTYYLQFPDGVMMVGTFDKYPSETEGELSSIRSKNGKLLYKAGDIRIDVNGKKPPNAYGKDIYLFVLSSDGTLYPYYGLDYAIYVNYYLSDIKRSNFYWKNDSKLCGEEGKKIDKSLTGVGLGCGARIIENGWSMDY